MDRAKKAEVIADLQETLGGVESLVVTKNLGLTAAQVSDLRVKMRKEGVDYKVSKNRLVLRALKGTRFEGIGPMLKGPVGIASSKDAVAAAKIAANFAKDNEKLVILGGALGDKVLDTAAVVALSKLPSLDELRGKLVGLLQAPAQRLATLSQAPAAQVARVIGAYAQKG
ncbi:MAG: 50S ribosomal protein L10 [Alphaproteobacteria bacterium]|nr:50S ribosomal protein L10 [Alphaproteobacteria bacterium]